MTNLGMAGKSVGVRASGRARAVAMGQQTGARSQLSAGVDERPGDDNATCPSREVPNVIGVAIPRSVSLWHVPDLGSEWRNEDGWVVLAATATEARERVLALRREQFAAYFDGPDGLRDRSGNTARSWSAESWDRETWRRWYYFGVRVPQTRWGDLDDEVGEPTEVADRVFAIPFLGYSW